MLKPYQTILWSAVLCYLLGVGVGCYIIFCKLSGDVYDYLSIWYMFVGIPVLAVFTYFIWKAKQEYGRKYNVKIDDIADDAESQEYDI